MSVHSIPCILQFVEWVPVCSSLVFTTLTLVVIEVLSQRSSGTESRKHCLQILYAEEELFNSIRCLLSIPVYRITSTEVKRRSRRESPWIKFYTLKNTLHSTTIGPNTYQYTPQNRPVLTRLRDPECVLRSLPTKFDEKSCRTREEEV